MPIIGVKTGLNVSIEATDTPKTDLIQNTDNGSGIQESSSVADFGSELVSNGTFATVTTGWTASGATLTIDTARLKCANAGAARGYAYQSIITVVGKTYRIQADIDLGDADEATIAVGNSAGNGALGRFIVGSDKDFTFVATATATIISLINGSAVSGKFTFFDNVSVKLSNGSLHFGTATDGTAANERVIKKAINNRAVKA